MNRKIVKLQSFVIKESEVFPTTVEVCVMDGIGIHVLGLPDKAVKDSLLRTVTALQSLGYSIPGKKIVINILPMQTGMGSNGLDLPIAVGILAASGHESLPEGMELSMCGELGLDGCLRPCGEEDKFVGCCGNDLIISKDSRISDCEKLRAENVYCASTLPQVIRILKSGPSEREQYRFEYLEPQ